MKTRLCLLIVFVITASCQSVAPLATALPATSTPIPASPTPVDTPVPPTPTITPLATLKVVSSLPMTGGSQATAQAISNAMQLRLTKANNLVCGGNYKIAYEAWDDASAALGNWDPAVESDNAMKAAADKSIIAYLGTYNSGAARISIPILDAAGPLVMVSPANTYPGLTKYGTGDGTEPRKYYPAGVRNYTRVVATDDVQGDVDARYMFNQLGVKSVYILDDRQVYGRMMASAFQAAAKSLGMKVLGRESFNPKARDYVALMTRISVSNGGIPPDAIFAAMFESDNAAQLLKDKVTAMGDNQKVKFMGPDGILTQSFVDASGANVAEGVYASVGGLAFPDGLTDVGQQFVAAYQASYGELTEPYAIYGYETMNVLLKAIEDVCAGGGNPADRKEVRDAVFATKDFAGVLGTWSFDKNGDTTLTDMTIYVVKNGAYQVAGSYK